MTPAEITTQYLTGQRDAAQRTLAHAQQLHNEAKEQHARSKTNVEQKNIPLPEMHAAHHVLCVDGLKAATAYVDCATRDLAAAEARLSAHNAAQVALPVKPSAP